MTWFLSAALLTAVGLALVASASGAMDGSAEIFHAQLMWSALAVIAGIIAARIPVAWWRDLAVPAYGAALLLVLLLLVLAGSSLVPVIKGQANWLVLGSLRVQPVEFVKLASLLATAWFVAAPGFDRQRFGHVLAALGIAGAPAVLLVRGDTGSALTFIPMAAGIVIAAGMRWRHGAILAGTVAVFLAISLWLMPTEGPKAYQWRRIQAWLHPQDYALSEGFQTARAVSAIGSGQVLGKGWGDGDQNRLGLVPERHTDLVFAVAGEELGFLRCLGIMALYLGFLWLGILRAMATRDPFARSVIIGFVSLLAGQSALNLGVALGLLPVTGVTLPFLSYGGSSLLACWLGLGMAIGCGRGAPRSGL